MLTCEINAKGKTWYDLEEAVAEALRLIREQYLAGANSNDDGSFRFNIKGEPVRRKRESAGRQMSGSGQRRRDP